jgi:hypothetical protein
MSPMFVSAARWATIAKRIDQSVGRNALGWAAEW